MSESASVSSPAGRWGDDLVVTMPRQFTLWTLITFAIAMASAWMATSSLLPTHLMYGSYGAATWSPIVSGVASTIISIGLAELASAFPSSGGQYHYTFMVAGPKYQRSASFVVAWLTILAWLFITASSTIYPAQLTAQLAQIWYPSYTPERWQIWLIYAALLIGGTCVVIFGHSIMPKLEQIFCYLSMGAFVAFVVALLSASPSKQSGKTVFTEWENVSGWNDGFGFMLDIGQALWIYACMDSATHLAEEIYQADIHVPRVIVLSTLIAILCNVVFTLAALFSVSNISDVLSSSLPIYEVTRQAISNDRVVLFLLIWLDFTFVSTVPGVILTTGRLIWAFSRDGGLPYSSYFARIHPRFKVPVETTIVCCVFCLLYGLIYIGSTVAFNTFISSAVLFAFLSFSIPQGILLLVGRDTLPKRYYSLGKVFGTFVNAFSLAWSILYCILFCFPLSLPTTVQSMNYVSVVLVGGVMFVASLWFLAGKRKKFEGPIIRADILNGIDSGPGRPSIDAKTADQKTVEA